MFLFIKMFVVAVTEISKNTLFKRGIESDKSIGGRLPMYFMVWKLMAPTKQKHI